MLEIAVSVGKVEPDHTDVRDVERDRHRLDGHHKRQRETWTGTYFTFGRSEDALHAAIPRFLQQLLGLFTQPGRSPRQIGNRGLPPIVAFRFEPKSHATL